MPNTSPIAERAIGMSTSPGLSAAVCAPAVEPEGRVADDAPAVSGSVAGVAQIDQFVASRPLRVAASEQPVDRRSATGLLRVQVGLAIQDGARGVAVDRLRLFVGRDSARGQN